MWYMELIHKYVYLNNGGLNWDAIGIISNVILVSLLVFVNIRTISEMKKQAKFTNEQYFLSDCVDNFLKPFLDKICGYIKKIDEKKIYCNKSNGKMQICYISKIAEIVHVKRFTRAYVFKKHHDLKVLCLKYDVLYDEVVRIYVEIERVIVDTADEECLKGLLQEFKESKSIDLDTATIDPLEYFLEALVNYENNQTNAFDYEMCGDSIKIEFVKFDDGNVIKCIKNAKYEKLCEVRAEKVAKLKEKMSEIVVEVEKILHHYQQEYYIPLD